MHRASKRGKANITRRLSRRTVSADPVNATDLRMAPKLKHGRLNQRPRPLAHHVSIEVRCVVVRAKVDRSGMSLPDDDYERLQRVDGSEGSFLQFDDAHSLNYEASPQAHETQSDPPAPSKGLTPTEACDADLPPPPFQAFGMWSVKFGWRWSRMGPFTVTPGV